MKAIFSRIIFLGLCTCFLYSCVFSLPSSARKQYNKAIVNAPFDAIIVPGVPYDSLVGNWSDLMKIRVYWSYILYQKGIAKNIIYSGAAVYTPYVESKIMAMYAKELGIPESNIFIEYSAEHSTENVYYSFFMAQRLGFKSVALATDPFQTAMVKHFVKKNKLEICYLPMNFDTIKMFNMVERLPVDAEQAKVGNFIPLPEREGFLKRFRGTMGKNLKRDENDAQNR